MLGTPFLKNVFLVLGDILNFDPHLFPNGGGGGGGGEWGSQIKGIAA